MPHSVEEANRVGHEAFGVTPSGPLSELSAFQRDLLVAIARLGKPHGLAIKQLVEEVGYGENNVTTGRLYPNLDTLVDMGLVVKGQKDRRTNSYRVTRQGARELAGYYKWIGFAVREADDA